MNRDRRAAPTPFALAAVALALLVPGSTPALSAPGIGGDLFALVYVASEQELFALNSAGWATALEARGHRVRSVTGGSVGGYQGLLFTRDSTLPLPTFGPESVAADLPANGVYRAGLGHRKDGQAAGWER